MLLADKTVVNHNRGIQNANQFTIQQSAKMFNILSNSLYSDKVMAVIRDFLLTLMIVMLLLETLILLG